MKFYLAIFALIGLTTANNCGSAPLGSLGRRLDLEGFGNNRQQGVYGTGNRPNSPRRGGIDSNRPQGSGNTSFNTQIPQNGHSNQNSRGTNYACFPTPSSPVQFIQARPSTVHPQGTVIVTVSQNQAPQHIGPVSQSYVQTAFFPTVDFYPWGNTANRFTSVPTTTTPSTVTTPVTPTPTPSTSLPLPQPQPVVVTQNNVTQPPLATTPSLPVVAPLPTVQQQIVSTQPQNQGFELSSTYLFNQNNPNGQLNLTSTEPAQNTQSVETPVLPIDNVLAIETTQPVDTILTQENIQSNETLLPTEVTLPVEPVAPTLAVDPVAAVETSLPVESTVVTQNLPSEGVTAPASVPDFSEFDFTNFDFDNLDALLSAPAATPVPAQTSAV